MTLKNTTQTPGTLRHIGGSLLPSNEPRILQPLAGAYGTLQVRALPERDTHSLYFNETLCLASHPNGYSCHALAERILAVWRGDWTVAHAMAQFDYIIACGGEGEAREVVERIVRGTSD